MAVILIDFLDSGMTLTTKQELYILHIFHIPAIVNLFVGLWKTFARLFDPVPNRVGRNLVLFGHLGWGIVLLANLSGRTQKRVHLQLGKSVRFLLALVPSFFTVK